MDAPMRARLQSTGGYAEVKPDATLTSASLLLRDARERRHLSQQKLADLAGYGIATVSRIDRGDHHPPDRTLTAILKALAKITPFTDTELHGILAAYGYLPPDAQRRYQKTGEPIFPSHDRERLVWMGLLRSSAEEFADTLKTESSAMVAEHLARQRQERAAQSNLPDRNDAPAEYAAALPHHLTDRLIEAVGEVRAAHVLRQVLGILGAGANTDESGAAVLKLALPPMPRDDMAPGATEQRTIIRDPDGLSTTVTVYEPADPDAPRPLERADPPDAERKSG